MQKTAPPQLNIFFTSSLIYTSDGRLGHFFITILWLREDDKYKTRVLNRPINLTTRPSYKLVRHVAQNNAPQDNFTAVIKFYETLPS